MFRDTLRFLILSVVFYVSHQNEGVFTHDRDFLSKKLHGNIDMKFRHIGLFNPVGYSHFLKRAPKYQCEMTNRVWKNIPTGYILTTAEIYDSPNITWPSEEGHYYTLYIGDLDGRLYENPGYRDFQAYCIWLVGNIPGNDVQKGYQIFSYEPPKKPIPNELHRHLIIIYYQQHPEPIDFKGGFVDQLNSKDLMVEREDFRIDNFAEHYNYADAWAGNLYFICEGE